MRVQVHSLETGKNYPYEWYHNDVFINKEKCGTADYDKNQRLLICQVDFKGRRSKRFYHPNMRGIERMVQKWAEKVLFDEEIKGGHNEKNTL